MVPGRHFHFQGEHIKPLCHLSLSYSFLLCKGSVVHYPYNFLYFIRYNTQEITLYK